MPNLITTAHATNGGVATVAEVLEIDKITFGGTWIANETFTIFITDLGTGITYNYGYGDFSGQVPSFVFTYKNKLYILAGARAYFSAVGEPTIFNDPNGTFNGYVEMSNAFSAPENLVAIASFQGKLAFFSNSTIQIWNVDADPDNWAISQVLSNIGTLAPASVQSLGDLDVLFLSQSGVRSLRARDASSNAIPTDLGSPIDSLVQADIVDAGADAALACAAVEPLTKRFMLALNGNIYVLSYFPASEITAWSMYTAKDNNGDAFTPEKFLVFNNRLYLRDTAGNLYLYGGSDNATYDTHSQPVVELPWLDDGSPANKAFKTIDAVFAGQWKLEFCCDPYGATLGEIGLFGDPATPDATKDTTVGYGRLSISGNGVRFKVRLTAQNESTTTPAILSEVHVKYEGGNVA